MSGGSLSCTGYTTASRVRESLMQLQNALRARDVEALRAALLFPLRVNGCPGEMRDVAAADFAAQVETIFTPDTVAYVLSLKMADVWVLRNWRDPLEAGSGVGIGQGVMWWRNDDDGRTKVWGVNAGCRR